MVVSVEDVRHVEASEVWEGKREFGELESLMVGFQGGFRAKERLNVNLPPPKSLAIP